MTPPREPTADECTKLAPLGEGWRAIWYPQMGGYAGKAAVFVGADHAPGGCVEVFVWHDGEFPFSGGEREPVRLHHCDMQQFRQFANAVDRMEP